MQTAYPSKTGLRTDKEKQNRKNFRMKAELRRVPTLLDFKIRMKLNFSIAKLAERLKFSLSKLSTESFDKQFITLMNEWYRLIYVLWCEAA